MPVAVQLARRPELLALQHQAHGDDWTEGGGEKIGEAGDRKNGGNGSDGKRQHHRDGAGQMVAVQTAKPQVVASASQLDLFGAGAR